MWKRFKREGILLLAVGALIVLEGLAIGEPVAVAQNTNSSTIVQNSNSRPIVKRKSIKRRRGRRGRRP